MSAAGMGMSQTDAVAGGQRPVVKGSMGVDDIDLDDDDVRSLSLAVRLEFLPGLQFCIYNIGNSFHVAPPNVKRFRRYKTDNWSFKMSWKEKFLLSCPSLLQSAT